MTTGRLSTWKWADNYGFIICDDGTPDAFLHIQDLRQAGIDPEDLRIGDRLVFATIDDPVTGGPLRRATTLKIFDPYEPTK